MASRIYERVMVTRPLSVSEDVAPPVDPVAVVDGVAAIVFAIVGNCVNKIKTTQMAGTVVCPGTKGGNKQNVVKFAVLSASICCGAFFLA